VVVFEFTPNPNPHPLWHGPYSPVPGRSNGLRVRRGTAEALMRRGGYSETWAIEDSPGARALVESVYIAYGGGRLLLLPNGAVIKPTPWSNEGERRLVGSWSGRFTLVSPSGLRLCTSDPKIMVKPVGTPRRLIRSGDDWPGPSSQGLRCRIDPSGALFARTWHASRWGRTEVDFPIAPGDVMRALSYRLAGGHTSGGSVRLLEGGHLVMPAHDADGGIARYVGYVPPSQLPSISAWSNH